MTDAGSKSRKKIFLFGTRHYTVSKAPPAVKDGLVLTIEKLKPDVVLEEWSASQTEEAAASAICKKLDLAWKDIGTPPDGEFATYAFCDALDFPDVPTIYRYGPIEAQNKRETRMCANITGYMSSCDSALVVIGVAHLHSMFARLSEEFDVAGYSFANEFF